MALIAYQSAAPGSRLFNTRLIELVSRAIHQIAVELAFLDESPHKADGLLAFTPPESDLVFWEYSPDGPLPTWLHVQWYKNYKHYPNGSSDMIGYWAENYIIGGILLFERRHESSGPFPGYDAEIDPDGVYIHSDRDRRTNRICKLLDTQKKEYLDFLQADTDDAAINSPLPLRPSDDSLDRVDPEEPALDTGIYRDSWERLPLLDHENDGRLRDVFTRSDYPRFSDFYAYGSAFSISRKAAATAAQHWGRDVRRHDGAAKYVAQAIMQLCDLGRLKKRLSKGKAVTAISSLGLDSLAISGRRRLGIISDRSSSI
ncbi:hypothetical protein NHJ13051_006339 [Beauveria bassiana]